MAMQLTDEEWKEKLTPEQYEVMRKKGTESPYSGKLLNENRSGDFTCAACGQVIFKSGTKFESTAPGLQGWPSFSDPANREAVRLVPDDSHGMHRIEVICSNCGSHLGHLFDETPDSPSGKHYCINSCALDFKPEK